MTIATATQIISHEIAEFHGQVHRAENRLIRGIDKARQTAGTSGIGRAWGLRPRADWRVELAIEIGQRMKGGGHTHAHTHA